LKPLRLGEETPGRRALQQRRMEDAVFAERGRQDGG
jgi:hypothetical protein